MSQETRAETLARIQKQLVRLQDSINTEPEPIGEGAWQSREIAAMKTLFALIAELLPDDIALQVKATLSLLEQGVPIGE